MSITSLYYSYFSIIIIFAISLVTVGNWWLQLVDAQNATSVDFNSHTSPALGFSITYPSDWIVHEYKNGVWFNPTNDTKKPIVLDISINNVTRVFDTDTLTLKNATLPQIIKQWHDQSQDFDSLLNTHTTLLRQNDITIDGNAGVKMEYLNDDSYSYTILTIIDGKLFSFLYEDKLANVPVTVRLANKMVESFQITK